MPPLTPSLLLAAYREGVFPMADPQSGEISWFSPDPRAVIPLAEFTVPRSLRQLIHRRTFEIRVDTAFAEVMRSCAGREETWISGEIITAYTALHVHGYAHSVEAWRDSVLAGGLYGVSIGGAFFGESMFSRESGASKVALASLVERLRMHGFHLLDTQYLTPHLAQFGAVEIPRAEYLLQLEKALNLRVVF
jgi:leucyl/phenylalanyl-tRNA--protein transferase